MSEGDIFTVIDTFDFDAVKGHEPFLVHVDADIYLICYKGPDDDLWMCTVEIDNAGNITDPVVDTLEVDAVDGSTPSFVDAGADVFPVAYTGTDGDGFVSTPYCWATGTLSGGVFDKYEFETGQAARPHIIHVFGNIYAIVYTGVGDDGFVCTVDIDAVGNIVDPFVDKWEFATADGIEPFIIHISGTVYAVVYRSATDDGVVVTIDIDNSGSITAAVIDTLVFEAGACYEPVIFNISGDIFAIAYGDEGGRGDVITVEIDTAGNIGAAPIDSLVFNAAQGYHPAIVHVSGDVYAIFYNGSDSDGYMSTFAIDSAGNIGAAVIDSLEFDTGDCWEPSVAHVSGNVYAVAYRGPGNVGRIKTVGIETASPQLSKHLPFMGVG